jgi:ATP-dependent Lon protease
VEQEASVAADSTHIFLPVLPLPDVCLFPEASLTVVLSTPGAQKALELASRTGGRLLALAQRDAANPKELQTVGTVATVSQPPDADGASKVELDGLTRARSVTVIGTEALVAEVEGLEEGDPGDEWGSAVEALARYLHAHVELRTFLDRQRRSKEPMAWVNLACQHLPITVSARQKLLECGAAERCLKISRGLDALLRKEQGA